MGRAALLVSSESILPRRKICVHGFFMARSVFFLSQDRFFFNRKIVLLGDIKSKPINPAGVTYGGLKGAYQAQRPGIKYRCYAWAKTRTGETQLGIWLVQIPNKAVINYYQNQSLQEVGLVCLGSWRLCFWVVHRVEPRAQPCSFRAS